jgi:hypothetical protein
MLTIMFKEEILQLPISFWAIKHWLFLTLLDIKYDWQCGGPSTTNFPQTFDLICFSLLMAFWLGVEPLDAYTTMFMANFLCLLISMSEGATTFVARVGLGKPSPYSI